MSSLTQKLVPCLALALSACAGSLEDPERFEIGAQPANISIPTQDASAGQAGECPDVVTGIFAMRCATAGCHDAVSASAGLDLASEGVKARLVDQSSASCTEYLMIDSEDPESSLLLLKLGDSPPCGLKMPLGGSLSDQDIACVASWLTED